jgi:hypothetical protein
MRQQQVQRVLKLRLRSYWGSGKMDSKILEPMEQAGIEID